MMGQGCIHPADPPVRPSLVAIGLALALVLGWLGGSLQQVVNEAGLSDCCTNEEAFLQAMPECREHSNAGKYAAH